jgi:hypothetical protein
LSAEIITDEDSRGRLDHVVITLKGKRPLRVQYAYLPDGIALKLNGEKAVIPTYSELLAIIDAKYSEKLEAVNSLFNATTGMNEQQRTADISKAFVAFNTPDGTAIWTPKAGKRFRFMGWAAVSDAAAARLADWDGAAGTYMATILNTALTVPFSGNGLLSAKADNTLALFGNVGSTTRGTLWGTEE